MNYNFKNKWILYLCFTFLLFTTILFAGSRLKVFKYKGDFKTGEFENITLANPGYLTLSPKVVSYFDSGEPYLWAWAKDSKGNIFVGTGNEGKVFKVAPNKESSLFFDAPELEIYALAIDKHDNIFVATSPEGQIYKVTSTGKSEVYYNPPDKYIWDLAVDNAGNIFASTGDSCRIYKITEKNKGQVFFESQESHVEVMYLKADNTLLAGTVDNGYLYEIKPSGESQILFDTGYREIHSLALGDDGSIYLGVYGEKSLSRLAPVKSGKEQKSDQSETDNQTQTSVINELEEIQIIAQVPDLPKARFSQQEQSAVFKLTPEGAQQNIWNLSETVYAIAMNREGTVLVGTGGNNGHLYQLNQNEEELELLDVNDAQITALYIDQNDHIFMCTSNMGKIYEISHKFDKEGVYTSAVINADLVAQWGRLRWDVDLPDGTSIQFFTRSGNTSDVNQTWSNWEGPYQKFSDKLIKSPSAQYLQWKAVLKSKNENSTPTLNEVVVSYLQKNISPEISWINVNDPEEVLQETEQYDEEYFQEKPENNDNSQLSSPAVNQNISRKRMIRNVRWGCQDNNRDQLIFNIYYQDEDANNWRILQEKYNRTSYSWDSRKWPDGKYKIKIEASDSPVNPSSLARTVNKESSWFTVDNTGPVISTFNIKKAGEGAIQITFSAKDEFSTIFHTEFVTDSDDWRVLFPEDQISDSPGEQFMVELNHLTKGSHSFVVRSYDRFLNVGFGKFQFKVE